MPGYTVEKLADEPIILLTLLESWETKRDLPGVVSEITELLDRADSMTYEVVDSSHARLSGISLDDIVWGASQAARGAGAILHHPNLKECIVVTNSNLVSLAVKGLSSDIFGNVRACVVGTLDEALVYARSQ